MNTYCQLYNLNAQKPLYPIQSIPSLFLPRFNNFTDVDAQASLDNRPYLPYKKAAIKQPAPVNYSASGKQMYSSLPSGIANYDRLSIRDFKDVDSVYAYRQRKC